MDLLPSSCEGSEIHNIWDNTQNKMYLVEECCYYVQESDFALFGRWIQHFRRNLPPPFIGSILKIAEAGIPGIVGLVTLHGVTFEEAVIFIETAVRTSNSLLILKECTSRFREQDFPKI
jgi:hypothetical protein